MPHASGALFSRYAAVDAAYGGRILAQRPGEIRFSGLLLHASPRTGGKKTALPRRSLFRLDAAIQKSFIL